MSTALLLSSCASSTVITGHRKQHSICNRQRIIVNQNKRHSYTKKKFHVHCRTKGSAADSSKSDKEEEEEKTVPTWAKPGSDEPPPWARGEGSQAASEQSFEIPFPVYLLASTITAIAAIGSIFEYVNQRPVFGVLNSDSVFYAPLLGFFVFTGIPTSGFLWYKSVQAANKEGEEQDKRDGYL